MEMTAMSVVPPPMSTTMFPEGSSMGSHAPIMGLLDEISEHLLGDLEVGDDAVFHWFDGHHVPRCAAQHVLGVFAHRDYFAGVLVDRHDGGLVDDNPFTFGEHQRVGCAYIDRQVGGEQAEDRAKVVSVFSHYDPQFRASIACAPRPAKPRPEELVRTLCQSDNSAMELQSAPI